MGSNKVDLAKDTIYTHPSSIQCNASNEINSLKTSVSNGKNLIANAITGKGVATSSSDTFATMANNIGSIPVGMTDLQKLFISESEHTLLTGDNTTITGDTELTLYTQSWTQSIIISVRNGDLYMNCSKSSYGINHNGIFCGFRFKDVSEHLFLSSFGLSNGYPFTRGVPNCWLSNNAVVIQVALTPGYLRNGDRDIDYPLYWNSSHTDQSSRTVTWYISGYLYKDSSTPISISQFKSAGYS